VTAPLREMKVDRSRLPTPGEAPLFTFPTIRKSALSNGLKIWTVRHPTIPMVTLVILIRRGSADDPPGKEGLAAITVDMLDEGSGGRSAIEMHEALAAIGAHLDSDIGCDGAFLSLSVLSRFSARALSILGDIMVRPSLTDSDFTRVRQLRLHRLRQLRDMPAAVADRTFMKLLYGSHPYGHMPLGGEHALASMGVDDVRAFHAMAIKPPETTLVAVGDCDHDAVAQMAADAFGSWTGIAAEAFPEATPVPRPARLNVVPRTGAPQSELRIGHVAVARDTPDYHALLAANMVLGGQFVSRINLNLREDKGFTYGARTAFEFRRRPGPFVLQVSVHTAATSRAIQESIGEIAAIRGPRPVTDDELAFGISALTLGYARNFETAEQIARSVTQLALYDLPDDYYAQFVPRIERVTRDDVSRAMTTHVDPDRLTTLVVGDLEAIGRDLEPIGLGEPLTLEAEAI
jgi:zinc protease